MRPKGEIRQQLGATIVRLHREQGGAPVSCRRVAEAAQVGYDAARRAIDNMARAGEVLRTSEGHHPGSYKAHPLYVPGPGLIDDDDTPQPWGGIERLAQYMRKLTTSSDT